MSMPTRMSQADKRTESNEGVTSEHKVTSEVVKSKSELFDELARSMLTSTENVVKKPAKKKIGKKQRKAAELAKKRLQEKKLEMLRKEAEDLPPENESSQ